MNDRPLLRGELVNETTPSIDSHHTMLLVMDYQPAILNDLPDADELLPRLVEAIDVARSGGVRIGYVRLGFDDADYDAMPETNKGIAGIVARRRMHHRELRDRTSDTLILAGITTGGVVLSTVRDAADRDYRLYVLADGCADRDQDVHDLLTQKVFPRQAYVISIADLSNLLGPE